MAGHSHAKNIMHRKGKSDALGLASGVAGAVARGAGAWAPLCGDAPRRVDTVASNPTKASFKLCMFTFTCFARVQ